MIRPDAARSKDALRRHDRRHGMGPAGIEREMRDDLGDLARRNAVVERQVKVERHFSCMIARDKRGNRHQAAIARRKAWAFPYLAEKTLLIFVERRGARS